MIEVALVRLVGSSLTLMAEGYAESVPPGTVAAGYDLIGHLSRRQPSDIDLAGFLACVVGDLWHQWTSAGLPADVALVHVEAIPHLMDQYRPPDGFVTSMIAAALACDRQGKPSGEAPVRVAEAIVAKARAAGEFASGTLNEPITHFFLERMLARLFADLDTIARLLPAISGYLTAVPTDDSQETATADGACLVEAGHSTPQEIEAQAGGAEDAVAVAVDPVRRLIAETAAAHDVPASALHALLGAMSAIGEPAAPFEQADIAERARDLATLLTEIASISASVLPDAQPIIATMKDELASGNFAEASHGLDLAEALHLRAAQTDMAAAARILQTAGAVRAARGRIEGLLGAWRKASRHYAAAVRCLPQGDRRGRWAYLVLQAEALVRDGRADPRSKGLAEAVQVYAAAASQVSEQEAPLDWAATNVSLGNLLLALGDREQRPDRYRAAALHFRPAIDVLSRARSVEDWARAQLGLARALQALGVVQGDVVMLGEALFALRATLAVATPDRMPEDWAFAVLALADIHARLGRETGDGASYAQAAAAYRSILAVPTAVGRLYDEAVVQHKLGGVLLLQAGVTGSTSALREAIGVLWKAAEGHDAACRTADAARSWSDLGTAQWALGELESDLSVLSDAARSKLSALDRLESTGAEADAIRVRSELAALESSLAGLAVGRDSSAAA